MVISFSASALDLVPIAQPNEDLLPINRDEPEIACPQVVERLVKYNEMARQHDQGVNAFLGEVVGKMGEWHAQLQPLEGLSQLLAPGTFAVLEDGANKISLVSEKAYENTDLLANEMDRILTSLRNCIENGESLKRKSESKTKTKKRR